MKRITSFWARLYPLLLKRPIRWKRILAERLGEMFAPIPTTVVHLPKEELGRKATQKTCPKSVFSVRMGITLGIGVMTGFFSGNALADTLTLYAKLTSPTAYAMNTHVVRNSGLVENEDPEQGEAILFQLTNVDPRDVPTLQAALEQWISCYSTKCFRLYLVRAAASRGRVVLLGEADSFNRAYCLREEVMHLIESIKVPSGCRYTSSTNCSEVSIPMIIVGTKGCHPLPSVVHLINQRLYDADHFIHPSTYFYVDVESLFLKVTTTPCIP